MSLEEICIAVPRDPFPLTYNDQPTKGTGSNLIAPAEDLKNKALVRTDKRMGR